MLLLHSGSSFQGHRNLLLVSCSFTRNHFERIVFETWDLSQGQQFTPVCSQWSTIACFKEDLFVGKNSQIMNQVIRQAIIFKCYR